MSLLGSLESVVGPDGRGLISAWRVACWLPRDQFEIGVARLVADGMVRILPWELHGRNESVENGGILIDGVLHLVVEKLK